MRKNIFKFTFFVPKMNFNHNNSNTKKLPILSNFNEKAFNQKIGKESYSYFSQRETTLTIFKKVMYYRVINIWTRPMNLAAISFTIFCLVSSNRSKRSIQLQYTWNTLSRVFPQAVCLDYTSCTSCHYNNEIDVDRLNPFCESSNASVQKSVSINNLKRLYSI